eukprot:4970841-Amphidinium_carterae.1
MLITGISVKTFSEAVVTSGGHRLLQSESFPKWCYPCPMRVFFPPTEGVKRVNIVHVQCGSDHTLALTDR